MKIIRHDRITDLDKFEKVQYRESLLGSNGGYPVEAVRKQAGGFFGGFSTIEEEIARFVHKEGAAKLVKDIADAWIQGQDTFNVDEWIEVNGAEPAEPV